MRELKRVAIVVGEASGDILGAGLMRSLKARFPLCTFEGIGGPKMIAEGFVSHFSMERLAVMGLVDPLKRLPELLGIRKNIKQRYTQSPPDIFIGIDSPDFTLNIERYLKQKVGVPTVHYVSPSVWAWRKNRVVKIAQSVDLMLTLFPFEAEFYQSHAVRNVCVGHPLADSFPLDASSAHPRKKATKNIALMPGSRQGEVRYLCELFLHAAEKIHAQRPDTTFTIPAANSARMKQMQPLVDRYDTLPVTLVLGDSHRVMAESDAVLIASGTATLEAMLLKKPMVIAYKMGAVSYALLSRLVTSSFVGLPNILAGKEVVPELIQSDATPVSLSEKILTLLHDGDARDQLIRTYETLHRSIKKDASVLAAQAIVELFQSRCETP